MINNIRTLIINVEKQLLPCLFCKLRVHKWGMCYLCSIASFQCLDCHSVLIHNLCKVMQGGSGVVQVNLTSAEPSSLSSASAHLYPMYLAPTATPLSPCTRLFNKFSILALKSRLVLGTASFICRR